jgi:hypothetical protein
MLALLIALNLFLVTVGPANPLVASARPCPQPGDSAPSSGRGESRTIELPIDLDAVRERQKAFDHGHQPWRGDAIWVAAAAVTEAVGIASAVEPASKLVTKLVVECETPSESVVAGRDASNEYRVLLKRLLPPQKGKPSIWTALRVTVTPLN